MTFAPMLTRSLLCLAGTFLAFSGCTTADSPSPSSADAATTIMYQCQYGGALEASYPSDSTAVVTYADESHSMNIAISASGARYVGSSLEWWTKGSGSGSEGTIFRHNADGTTGDQIEMCTQL